MTSPRAVRAIAAKAGKKAAAKVTAASAGKKTAARPDQKVAAEKASAAEAAAPRPSASPAFERLVAAFAGNPRVEPPAASRRAFGSNGLKVNGRIFAMLVDGSLVVKLPEDRVDAVVRACEGEPFDAGRGRPMKEWLVVGTGPQTWLPLAREAMAFVTGAGKKASK